MYKPWPVRYYGHRFKFRRIILRSFFSFVIVGIPFLSVEQEKNHGRKCHTAERAKAAVQFGPRSYVPYSTLRERAIY